MFNKIPATVITGFLGSGKTTLIKHLLENSNGLKIALIVNEFGDLGIDGNLLEGCNNPNCDEDDIIELTNGCICCTVADDFIPAIDQILNREDKIDHIIIETSGLALPQPLVQAFNWHEIKAKVTINGVITVADAEALSLGRFASDEERVEQQRQADESLDHISSMQELFEDQIVCADMILLNKSEMVAADQLPELTQDLQKKARKAVPVVAISRGVIDAKVILGLDMEAELDIENRKSAHEKLHDEMHEKGEDHDHHHDHDHDAFKSIAIELDQVSDIEAFTASVQSIIEKHQILRLKGFVDVKDKDMRYVIQAVGPRIEGYFDRIWGMDETAKTKLVVISDHHFDEALVREELNKSIS